MEQSILLRARLKNCLTTILDMEEDFHSRGLDTVLRGELDFLKKYMDRVETLSLDESKVERLESVTARILSEFDADGPRAANRYCSKHVLACLSSLFVQRVQPRAPVPHDLGSHGTCGL